MTSIGPQVPEHLLKKRLAGEDEEDEGNTNVETGPGPVTAPGATIGPEIPKGLTKPSVSPSAPEDEDDDDDYGPELPPDLLAKRSGVNAGPASKVSPARTPSEEPPRRVLGPSLPGHDRQSHSDAEDSDNDDYGPMPLPAGVQTTDSVSEGVREFLEKEERRRREVEEAAKPKKPKRDEWMLVPPSSSDLLGHLGDPTKLKARQFSRGTGSASRSVPNNLWTETPQERQQRIADEVAGKKRRAVNVDEDALNPQEDRRKRKRDAELKQVVEKHNKSSRDKTLLEMHESERKKEKKSKAGEEEPAAIWDHARDMSVGGKLMDEKQRGKLISDARSLGDRFGSGRSGGYL